MKTRIATRWSLVFLAALLQALGCSPEQRLAEEQDPESHDEEHEVVVVLSADDLEESEEQWIELGPETRAAIVKARRGSEPVLVEKLY